MADLTTKYLGLQLKNPIVVGSCTLTSTIEEIVELEKNGAGAVVLKSIFEEEILLEANFNFDEADKNSMLYTHLSETIEYIDIHTKEKKLDDYLKLIRQAKKQTSIPIIASINCVSSLEWAFYAKKIQEAGADALELNIFMNPGDLKTQMSEKEVLKIINAVLKTVNIPVAVKLANCFTNLAQNIIKISKTGVAGLVLFNKYYLPDIDIHNHSLMTGRILSSQDDYRIPLRWMAMLSGKVGCNLAASTGIFTGIDVVKLILAGADVVQLVSTLYVNGKNQISTVLNGITEYMETKGFFALEQFRGKVTYNQETDPAVYERLQFMKKYGRIG